MQIDHCLIMAAGFGTRMGQIGQQLPKVLWPVFERPILELQVAYARSLGIKNIYINLHYMAEQILEFCKDRTAFEDVKFLWEKPEILDIGGAIHNLAGQPEVQYQGKLLVLNADQFFYLRPEELRQHLIPYQQQGCVLFSYPVKASLGYNALKINQRRLIEGIVPNKELAPESVVETYTGISLIDLASLDKVSGKSPFFASVCDFTKKPVPAVLLENVDYWDFGTVKRYWETSFRILDTYRKHSTHPFLRFLVQERALKTWKINLQELSYHARSPRVINLNPDEEGRAFGEAIILRGNEAQSKKAPMIWWNNICEEVK